VDEHVYVDKKNEHVYVAETDAAQLELVDALAAALELGSTRNRFVELVEGAVGKSQSLVDAYLYSHDLPREHIKTQSHSSEESLPDRNEGSSGSSDSSETDRDDGSGTSSGEESYRTDESTKPDIAKTEDRAGEEPANDRPDPTGHNSVVDGSTEPSDSDGLPPATSPDSDWGLPSNVAGGGATDSNRGGWSRLSGGGAGTEDPGNAGEQFVLDYLRDLFESELNDAESTDPTDTTLSDAYQISGHYGGRAVTVTIGKVPDHDEPHSDLLVDGALLIRDGDEFAVDRVAADERTLVEVKSTKKNSSKLRLTPAEQREAKRTSEYLIARPVDVGSDDERLDTVFDTIPMVHVNPDRSGRLDIQDFRYEGMWLSY